MKKIFTFLAEVRSEMAKVIWPKRDEAVRLTLLVLTISLIIGILIGGLDLGFTKGLEIIISQ